MTKGKSESVVTKSEEPKGIPYLGLTGAPSVGKTKALELLRELGASVLSSDTVVHSLYETVEVRNAVVDRWGEKVLASGQVDRRQIAKLVFSSEEDRLWLEGLIWPRVSERISRWKVEQSRLSRHPRALVVEVPLLFEAGLENTFDATITIVADEKLRRKRAEIVGLEAQERRAELQLSQAEKAAKATYVVDNSGSIKELGAALEGILGGQPAKL